MVSGVLYALFVAAVAKYGLWLPYAVNEVSLNEAPLSELIVLKPLVEIVVIRGFRNINPIVSCTVSAPITFCTGAPLAHSSTYAGAAPSRPIFATEPAASYVKSLRPEAILGQQPTIVKTSSVPQPTISRPWSAIPASKSVGARPVEPTGMTKTVPPSRDCDSFPPSSTRHQFVFESQNIPNVTFDTFALSSALSRDVGFWQPKFSWKAFCRESFRTYLNDSDENADSKFGLVPWVPADERSQRNFIGLSVLIGVLFHILLVLPPPFKRRLVHFLSAYVFVVIESAAACLFVVDNQHVRQKLSDIAKETVSSRVQDIFPWAWSVCYCIYRDIIVRLCLSSPMCIYFWSNHSLSTEEPEPVLCAPHYAGTGNVSCDVELSTEPLKVSVKAGPREHLARLCLVSVTGPHYWTKMCPASMSTELRAEKDGVDHKDTSVNDIGALDPWVLQVSSSLDEIEARYLRSGATKHHLEKPCRASSCDDKNGCRQVLFAGKQECMPASRSLSDAGRHESEEDALDLGTRVANHLALQRFNADTINNIFEECGQAQCAVSFLSAEVRHTEMLRKYRTEIQYVYGVAKQDSPPTQSMCGVDFESTYRDEHSDILTHVGTLRACILELLDRVRWYDCEHLRALSECAVPEAKNIEVLVDRFFNDKPFAVTAELTSVEVALKKRALIDTVCLEKVTPIYKELLEMVNKFESRCDDYFRANGEERLEADPQYEDWLLSQRLIAYSVLPF